MQLKPDSISTNETDSSENSISVKVYTDKYFGIEADSLSISKQHASITFSLSVDSFLNSDSYFLEYQLTGIDASPVNFTTSRLTVCYNNLTAGLYFFNVKRYSKNRKELYESKRIPLLIESPLSVYFWILALLLIMFITLILWLYLNGYRLINHKTLQNQLSLKIERKLQDIIAQQQFQRMEIAERDQEVNQMKLRFFTNISHEIRTPLTLLLGPIEKLRSTVMEFSMQQQVEVMNRNARKLLNLINQLLDFRKIEEGGVRLFIAEVDLGQMIRELILAFQEVCDKKHIQMILDQPAEGSVKAWIDNEKMDKILGNLMFNAIKYTPEYGAVTIKLREITDKSAIEIQVIDTGKGIPQDDIGHIFERYYQARESMFGSGIGLSLTYELLKLHKGDISVESLEGKGTCFTVTLPMGNLHLLEEEYVIIDNNRKYNQSTIILDDLNPDYPVKRSRIVRKPKPKNTPLLLIVEDNSDLRGYIIEELADTYNLIEAANGEDGIKLATERLPDLIISDVMMEPTDGIELCQTVKKNQLTSHIPVILLTARSLEEYQEEGFDVGADDYIVKPFNTRLLKARVGSLIANRRNLREKYLKEKLLEPSLIIPESSLDVFMQKVIALIESRISDTDLNLAELVKDLNISQAQLYRKIKAVTGYTVNDFVKVTRLKRAAQLLEQSSLQVSEVAYSVGFNNPRYFSDCFKDYFKINPREYSKSKLNPN